MYRDIDGADMHIDDPLDLMLRQVGQRDIVAEQEGKAAVVILKIETVPHAGRHLINKTEHALVTTGMLAIHEVGLKFEAKLFLFVFPDAYRAYPLRGLHA